MGYGPDQSVYTTQVPSEVVLSGANNSLGADIVVAVPGRVTALRYYRHTSQTGTRSMRLWSGGTQIGAVIGYTGSGSGWQTLTLASPVDIPAQTVRVSLDLPAANDNMHRDAAGVAVITNGNLQRTSVYLGTSGARPTSGSTRDYYVDLVFQATVAVPTTGQIWPRTRYSGTPTPPTTGQIWPRGNP